MDLEIKIKEKLKNILGNENSHKLLINTNNLDTFILSGGGVKGIYYIGILKYLEELNIIKNIKNIAGTSIGAFFGALISIGYTSKELADFVLLFDLSKIKNINFNNFFSFFGLDCGNNLEIILEKMFEHKKFNKNTTFKELYDTKNINLIITGACINNKRCYYFSHINSPNMKIIEAIKISTAVPLYFNPVKYDNKLWVDGGIVDNYPIHIFKDNLINTLGVYLTNKKIANEINNLEDYFFNIFQTAMLGMADRCIHGYEQNTIIVETTDYNLLNTNFNKQTIIEFINNGYNCAKKFI